MSPRSRIVGPGRPPSAARRSRWSSRARVTSSGRPSSAASTCSRVTGRSLPTSGQRCSVRRSSTVGVEQVAGLLAQRARCRRPWGHGRHGPCSARAPGRRRRAGRRRRRRRPRRRHGAALADARRAAAPPRRVRRRRLERRRPPARAPPQRGEGPLAGSVGHRRRRRRRAPARRTTTAAPPRAGRGARHRTRCRAAARSAQRGATTTPTSTLLGRCYRVVHDGAVRASSTARSSRPRWVDRAGLDALVAADAVRARQPGRCCRCDAVAFPFRRPCEHPGR